MHPCTEELIAHLAAERDALRLAVDVVPPPLQHRRPSPDRWSVADVVHHLSIVEGQVARLLAARIEAARAAGLRAEDETSPVVPSLGMGWALDRERKVTAPTSAQPAAHVAIEEAWAALELSRAALLDVIRGADGLALGEVTFPHPAAGPLSGYQWIAFVGFHEARHAAQIREIGDALEESVDRSIG